MSDERKFAFQCKNCGALETAEQAGDNPVPRACHVCGHGVRFETKGRNLNVVNEPENWIVLADQTPDELAKDFDRHGLKPENVVRHTPKTDSAPEGGAVFEVVAEEQPGAKDKAGA